MTLKTDLVVFNELEELQELEEYLNKENLNDNFIQEISEFKTKLENNAVQRIIPIFIPLYQYNKDVCDALNRIIKESNTHEFNREYFVFTNTSKLNTLTPLRNIKHLNIVEVPDSVDSIQKKRVFMFNYAKENGFKHIFQMDDDIFCLSLPILEKHFRKRDGKEYLKNTQFPVSNNLFFDVWEFCVLKYDLKHSTIMTNMNFTFRVKMPLVNPNIWFGMIFHCNIEDAVKRGISYDINSGWEDVDYALQYLNNGITTHGLVLMFRSPTYSEKSSEKKNIQEYFENNTNKLFDKWNKINPEYVYEKIVERNNIKIRYPVINFKKYFKKLYKEGKLHE